MRLSGVFLLFSSVLLIIPAYAKEEKKPVDKKEALVDQIIEAVNAEKLMEEEKTEFKKKGQERIDRFIDVIAEKTKMSPEDKQKLKDKLSKRCAEKQSRTLAPEVKDRIEKELALKEFSRNLAFQVMGDHFDDHDLKNILKFIKSSTGKKILKQAPDMIAQMIELSAERYVPLAMDMLKGFKVPDGLQQGSPHMSPEQRKELMEKLKRLLQRNNPVGPGKDET